MIGFTNLTELRRPRLAWEKIKDYVLGRKYDLSVVFAGDSLLRKLNSRYRGRSKPTSVLSFSLSNKKGEIFINLRRAKKEEMAFLFIHSLLHLKGFEHGVKMERKEKEVIKKFYG